MDKVKDRVCKLERGEFKFECPKCGYEKLINGNKFKKLKRHHRVGIKCKCGDTQRFVFERRNKYRKATELTGVFYHTDSDGWPNSKDIHITDISSEGMCFQAKDWGNITPISGDKVLIKFKLNEMANSMVTKEASIKHIQDNFFHVEFSENSKAQNDLCLKIFLYS